MDSSFRQSHPHNLFLKHRTTRQERGHSDKQHSTVTNTAHAQQVAQRHRDTDTDTRTQTHGHTETPGSLGGETRSRGGCWGSRAARVRAPSWCCSSCPRHLARLRAAPGTPRHSLAVTVGDPRRRDHPLTGPAPRELRKTPGRVLHPELCSARHQCLACSEDTNYS